jgi:hypothetical protein
MSVAMPELAAWDSFYVIVGSAAGALIGLQFVVMTLIVDRPPIPAAEAGAAFATPTIVHFGAALLLSALLRVPWPTVTSAAALWGLIGLTGAAYTLIVARRMRLQAVYTPGLEDWLFHVLLPLVAYAALALSATAAHAHTREVLFVVGAATLLLLFVGIHNAWDAVAYMSLLAGATRTLSRVGTRPWRGVSDDPRHHSLTKELASVEVRATVPRGEQTMTRAWARPMADTSLRFLLVVAVAIAALYVVAGKKLRLHCCLCGSSSNRLFRIRTH